MIGSLVVAEARTWKGTPFKWQGQAKQVGCDCMGLVAGVARAVGREAEAGIARWNYGDAVPARELIAGLSSVFDKVREAEPGDILAMTLAGKVQHLAIYAGGGRMIHTYSNGPCMVIEVPMGHAWWPRVHSVWRWR